jgi:hypothetical protein
MTDEQVIRGAVSWIRHDKTGRYDAMHGLPRNRSSDCSNGNHYNRNGCNDEVERVNE